MKRLKQFLKQLPELVSDIYERGLYLSGGGALMRGLDQAISQAAKIPVKIVDDPLTCVARGTGLLLGNKELLEKVVLANITE